MMDWRAFIARAAALLAAPLTVEAEPAKMPRLMFLRISPASAYASRIEGLRHGLRELGYIEGKNITIECRYADSRAARLPDLAMELVRLLVETGVEPTHAAKQVTTTIGASSTSCRKG